MTASGRKLNVEAPLAAKACLVGVSPTGTQIRIAGSCGLCCSEGIARPRLATSPQAYRTEGEMSDCLHCDINQLVQQRVERGDTDLAEVASMVVESLADLILLAPEDEQPNLMAYVLTGFGQIFLEKSGEMEDGSSATH